MYRSEISHFVIEENVSLTRSRVFNTESVIIFMDDSYSEGPPVFKARELTLIF